MSAHYPPIAGAQATRVSKLIKYLPSYGWIPDVIALNKDAVFGDDRSCLKDIPREAHVARVGATQTSIMGLVTRLAIPESASAWIPVAIRTALSFLRKNRYDALLSFSFPPSSHIAALGIHLIAHLPWLADFSDPWTRNPYSGWYPEARESRRSERLESEVLRRASLVGWVTSELRDYQTRVYSFVEEKSLILTNATELSDFPTVQDGKARKNFVLTHVGNLYGIRKADYLLDAFARFCHAFPEVPSTLRFVGNIGPGAEPDPRLIAKAQGAVEFVPFSSRQTALEQMVSADVVVLIDPSTLDRNIFLPMKLVEYLISGRPILALTTSGPSADLVSRYSAGEVVRYDNAAEIERGIVRSYERSVRGTSQGARHVPEFEASNVGRTLASALDSIAITGR